MDNNIVNLHSDLRGTLGVIEFTDLPFEPKRFFWIFNTPENVSRAGHGHKVCKQVLFCQQGRVQIRITNLTLTSKILELTPGFAVFLDKLNWLELMSFSDDALLGVFASEHYNRDEYIEHFEEFKMLANPKI